MASFYPIYIDIENQPVLVVGGGSVAWRKTETLLKYGALVRIVSPRLIPQVENIIDRVRCSWICKEYSSEDIQDAVLIFSCTEKEEINARIAEDGKRNFRLVNVVDDPHNCSFIVPSVMKRGDLSIAVSTGGSSPMAAQLIRLELEEMYGNEMKEFLEILRSWRQKAIKQLPSEKKQFFLERVADGQIMALIKKGQIEKAKEVIEDCFQSLLD